MQRWKRAVETNIQKMQVLLETVRAGSFTRAAERLSYSQSGVSRMVADLEAIGALRCSTAVARA